MEHEAVLKERIRDLAGRLQAAEDRVIMLEQALGVDRVGDFGLLGFTAGEARIVSVLSRRVIASRYQLYSALYLDRHDHDNDPEPHIVDIYLVRIRKRLAELGVTVTTRYRQGWTLGADGRARVNNLLAAARLT